MEWKYEYKVAYLDARNILHAYEQWFQQVNDVGRNGWEMCGYSMMPFSGPTGTNGAYVTAIFKGPLGDN